MVYFAWSLNHRVLWDSWKSQGLSARASPTCLNYNYSLLPVWLSTQSLLCQWEASSARGVKPPSRTIFPEWTWVLVLSQLLLLPALLPACWCHHEDNYHAISPHHYTSKPQPKPTTVGSKQSDHWKCINWESTGKLRENRLSLSQSSRNLVDLYKINYNFVLEKGQMNGVWFWTSQMQSMSIVSEPSLWITESQNPNGWKGPQKIT